MEEYIFSLIGVIGIIAAIIFASILFKDYLKIIFHKTKKKVKKKKD
jgi:hypothetical protein